MGITLKRKRNNVRHKKSHKKIRKHKYKLTKRAPCGSKPKTKKRTKRNRLNRKKTYNKEKRRGGNLLGNPVFSKIISIGFEFESPYLMPFKLNKDESAYYQIEPLIHDYDVYYEDNYDGGNTSFKVTTDNELTPLNQLIRKHNSKLAIRTNDAFIPIHNMYEGNPNEKDLGLGHTEFITTFYYPQMSDNIIRTNMKRNIDFINDYIHSLQFIPVDLYLENKTLVKAPWTLLLDEEDNYYLPTFIDKPVPTTMADIERDLRFTIQMTFRSEFTDCIDIVNALLANSKNETIQEQAVFLNGIVNAVKDTIGNIYRISAMDTNQQTAIKYLETFVILLVHRYEVYKVFEANGSSGYYKDKSYFYIRHKFDELLDMVLGQRINLSDIDNVYKALIVTYPQYKSNSIGSFLKTKIDPLNINHDAFSKRYAITDGTTAVLIEFRGFQDEIAELINTYTDNKYQAQINRDLEECSEAPVGCYSLKILNEFAKVKFKAHDEKRASALAIMNAPRQSRTVKAPSKLNL